MASEVVVGVVVGLAAVVLGRGSSTRGCARQRSSVFRLRPIVYNESLYEVVNNQRSI